MCPFTEMMFQIRVGLEKMDAWGYYIPSRTRNPTSFQSVRVMISLGLLLS